MNENDKKEMGEIIIAMAKKISKLQAKLLDVERWARNRQYDSVKKLWEILER